MYTQAATAMTTMLATPATATDDSSWSPIALGFGLWLMIVGMTLWTDDRRTQMNIGIVIVVIGLLIAIAGITAL